MKVTIAAFRSATIALSAGLVFGCAKPDLTITNLTVVRCNGPNIRYSYTILNRDYNGNLLVHPGSISTDVAIQAWLSSRTTLNQYDGGDSAAGGTTLQADRDYGGDNILSPGETASGAFSSTAARGGNINLNATPNLILKVDPRSLFDPASTTAGAIKEWNESNNVRWVPIVTCN